MVPCILPDLRTDDDEFSEIVTKTPGKAAPDSVRLRFKPVTRTVGPEEDGSVIQHVRLLFAGQEKAREGEGI